MHVVQFFPGEIPPRAYGGIERVVFWLTRELLARGCHVTLIAAPASTITDLCPEVNFIPYRGPEVDYRRLIPRDADVVHLHQSPESAALPDLPFLVTEHGNRKRVQQVQNTVFLSRSHARNHGSSHFVYNGIPKNEYPFCPYKVDSFLFLAKLGWRVKNAKTAINLSFDTRFPLVLAGGDLWDAKKIRGTWLLRWPFYKDLVRCVGDVGGDDKLALLQRSALLFYLVNWAEPFALAPHEALACGTPVLASPNGALPEYVEHGKNGYIARDYASAVDAVESLRALSRAERRQMSEYCRESAFSIESCADGYLRYYEKVISDQTLYSAAELAQLVFKAPASAKISRFFG